MRRAWVGLVLGAIVVLGASPSASPSEHPYSSPTPTPAPTPWPMDLEASVLLGGTTLAVTKAFADSIEDGIHLVPVRIVEAMDVAVTLKSPDGLTLAEAPTICLYWHDAAPDDAGLESPCWGLPDPSAMLTDMVAADDGWTLQPQHAVSVGTTMRRAPGTCDYPPGDWIMRLRVVPELEGVPQEPLYLRTSFEVPDDATSMLPDVPLAESRFCGLASEVVVEQGVPPTLSP